MQCKLTPSEPLACTEHVTLSGIESPAGAVQGNWTELALDYQIPDAWHAIRAYLRVYAGHASGEMLVADVKLSELDVRAAGASWVGRVRVSGQYGGFRAVVYSPDATPVGEGIFTFIVWGEESGLATIAGEDATLSVTPSAAPLINALALGVGTDNRLHALALDASKNLKVSGSLTVTPRIGGVWTDVHSTALEASHVIAAAPATLRSLDARLDATAPTATYYLQVYDAAAVPADGAVALAIAPLKFQHTLGADQRVSVDLTENGLSFATGISVALSSTEFVKTIAGAYLVLDALKG